jgi:hypothetical protein
MSRYLETCAGCGASRVLFVARNGLCIECSDEDQLDLAPERNVKPASANYAKPNSHRRPPKELPPCRYGGKASFRSAAKATRAIRDHAPGSPTLYAYRCPNCSLWHITSWPQNGRRAS